MNDGITTYKGQWYNPLNKIIIITKAQMNTDLYLVDHCFISLYSNITQTNISLQSLADIMMQA